MSCFWGHQGRGGPSCGRIGTRVHSHRATDTSTDSRARRLTRQRQRNCCAPARYASFGVPLSTSPTRRNRATRQSAVASPARSSLASPATHVRCAAAAAAANARPAAGEGRKSNEGRCRCRRREARPRNAMSSARPRRNPRSSPSSRPCSVVVLLPAMAVSSRARAAHLFRRQGFKRRRRRRMMRQYTTARAALVIRPHHQRDRAEIRDFNLRRDRAPSPCSSPPVAVSARASCTSVPKTPIEATTTKTDNDAAHARARRAALATPRHQRDRAEIRDRHLRRDCAPSSCSSLPVAVSSHARAARPFRRHRSNRQRRRRIMMQHARTRAAPRSPRHITSATAPKSAIVTFVATVLRRRAPPLPSPSPRVRAACPFRRHRSKRRRRRRILTQHAHARTALVKSRH